jgi:CheY-like chemotaxis protein
MRRASAAEITEITEREITTDVSEENLGENLGGVVFCGRDPAREESREEREEETRVARTARLAEETRGDGGCVLIVEDNLMNQKVAKVVVKRCGMRSDVANNGREAIDALTRGGRYDAILMDIQMPVMDGLDATREIRRLEAAGAIPRAPGGGANFIVAVSANATAENHQEGFEAGMDDYITKPIYPTRLRELLMTPRAR